MNTKLLQFVAIGFLLTILTSCSSENNSNETEAKLPIVTVYDYSPIELETMTLINNYRVSIGLNALEKINHVSYKSEEHDEYMIANNVVNHDDFVARSENIIKALGALRVSENVAYNYSTAQGAFDAWMNSPGHRLNIEGDFTHFGLSIRENPVNGRKYYTNIFVKM
ncbi:MAG TPA: CAP domain-containing protein [Flavobacterium sp.]|uniref:CAP domain-containing protein n=1 Tax=Flavobacterium sp. TaxID=239 RepID=UPI002DB84006|nr:CAP domain-containing protein [Flavobacterium sp.]HEU4789237.1 CAP domain-containing protein [Flavobacterium sp.]